MEFIHAIKWLFAANARIIARSSIEKWEKIK